MSVAALLTQPKLVEKLANDNNADSIETLAEDIIVLLRRIIANPEKSEAIFLAFKNGFEQFGNDFINGATDFEGGIQQLTQLMNPLISELESFGGTDAFEEFASAIEFVADKFIALMDTVANLSVNDIRSFISQLLTILESKFGFSLDVLMLQSWSLFDSVIDEVKTIPEDADREERELRLATAGLLMRLKRELQSVATVPSYTNDDIADTIMKILREAGLDGWVQDANEIAEAVKAVLLAADSIGDIIQMVGDSVGAAKTSEAGDTYCWYASWLLQSRQRDFGHMLLNYLMLNPSDEVWVTADKTQVVWRTVHGDDIVLHEGTDVKWTDAPYFSSETGEEYVLFEKVSADSMEFMAKLSYVLMEFGKMVWNTVDATESGDHATAITHAIWNAFNTGFGALGDKPFISYLVQAAGWGQGHQGWMNLIFPLIGTFLPSLEGRQTEADEAAGAFWFILLLDDILERFGHHALLGMIRDVWMSLFTLINNIGGAEGSDSSHPINKEYTAALAGVGGYGAQIIFLKFIYKKEDYKYPVNGFLWSFAGALAGLCGGLVGTCLSAACATAFSTKDFFIDIGVETLKGFALFYVNAYSWVENDTDGGTFNGTNDAFSGYPSKEDSPYKLPYGIGETKMCVQGHQGMWSHFASDNQIYAVDFGFDQGELIRASRPGTVVGYFENVPNDNHTTSGDGGWNYIIIRHDQAEDASVRENHDTYHDNNTYITYAIYGHGRQNGVTEAFHERGEMGDPLHKVVAQGDVIMKAGNTGVSFHNHLHMQIKTRFEAHAGAVAGNTLDINSVDFTSDTMPFVFADVDGDGVVSSLAFYTSQNGTS
ncbi:MAG: M23 family metallopeptidase [Pseudomonadales bacterium]|nr:M23 family metallopeptidase [Pseudomonadales bacterium]